MVDSSVPGIRVKLGYDAEIFVDTGSPGNPGAEAVQLAMEQDGSILASSNYRVFPSFDSPVYRFTPLAQLLGTSTPIRDPDGICVDPMGRIMVGGGRKVTLVNSLDGGTDVDFAAVDSWDQPHPAVEISCAPGTQ